MTLLVWPGGRRRNSHAVEHAQGLGARFLLRQPRLGFRMLTGRKDRYIVGK